MRKDNKKLPKIHKIIAFIVINFAVYVNVFYVIGKQQRNLVVLITVLRNYTNALAISQSHRIFPRHIFEYEDYQVWVLNNMLAMTVNVGLLLYANIDPQLIFAIVCVYLGSYGFLTYYNIKYINTIKEQEEQQHLEDEIEQYLT